MSDAPAPFRRCILAASLLAPLLCASLAQAACKEDLETQAEGPVKALAEVQATARWRIAARNAHGAEFARWSYARRKTVWCHKQQPGSPWRCYARAVPCSRS